MHSFMLVPEYYTDLVEIISSADWLLHNFEADDVDIYNAVNYQHNRQFDGVTYKAIVDMNIMQYLLNIVRKPSPHALSRTASAYLAFFKIADIELDPTYAIYEKISYSENMADEAISNLEQLRGIDNYDLNELAGYALGYFNQLPIEPKPSKDREELKKSLLQYRRLTDWDSLYLCILVVSSIAIDSSIPRPKKLSFFSDWCVSTFRFSLPALVYAAALFGKLPAKKMMKYKTEETRQNKQKSLYNMTWDLYYIDRYMKSWISKSEGVETLLLTADTGLRLTMKLAISCQLEEGLDPLRPHIGGVVDEIDEIYASRNSKGRVYKSGEWGYSYREGLISKYESHLL